MGEYNVPGLDRKLSGEWNYWLSSQDRLKKGKAEREAWLRFEVQFIAGLVYRATKLVLAPSTRVLQIGAGPVDVIDFFPPCEKHAIDPLADRYKQLFRDYQDSSVKYIKGVGEQLPYENDYFDFVVVRNALDHVYDPAKVLREIRRVLKPNGILYVWIHLYDRKTSIAYRILNAVTRYFETEPWAFTLGRIKALLRGGGFQICHPACIEERENEKLAASTLKGKIASLLVAPKHPTGYACALKVHK